MRNVFAAGLFLLYVLSVQLMPVFGAETKITVVVDNGYPPYMFGTMKQANGLYPTLIERIFTHLGITVEIQAFPWKRALKMGQEMNVAIGGIYKNDVRLTCYDYSDPLFEECLLVYVKKGKWFLFTHLSDLQGKEIGLNRGWSYGEEFDTARKEYHLTVQEADTNGQNFKKLIAGRIDCLVVDQVAAYQIIKQEKLEGQVEKLDRYAAVNKAYLVFAKQLKQRPVLNRFNKTLAEMKRDGTYQKIVLDYLPDLK